MSRREWVNFARRTLVRGPAATLGAVSVRRAMLRHATPRKLLNFIAIKIQKRLRRDTIRGRPYRYKIDPTNVCRMRCPLCPTGLGVLPRPHGFMDLGLYRRLIDRIAPRALILDLFGWGEPLLHPGLPVMIRYASERNVFTRLSTTLNDCDDALARSLVDTGLDAVVVAVDGASEATYGDYRRGGRLSRVVAGVRRLLDARERAGSATPHLTVRMLVTRRNEHEIAEVRALSSRLGADAFSVGTLAIDHTDEALKRAWLPRDPRMNDYADGEPSHGSCDDLWEAMIVNWDGGCAPCCWVYDGRHDLARVGDGDPEGEWNGPAFIAARRAAAGREPDAGGPEVVCEGCRGRPTYLADARVRVSRSG